MLLVVPNALKEMVLVGAMVTANGIIQTQLAAKKVGNIICQYHVNGL